jgi:alpha-glucosidase (family GH31 glycosyl hydrolase)
MVAPVIEQGAKGRAVYLPEDMIRVRFDGENFHCEPWRAGHHEVLVNVNEVVFFIRQGCAIPVANQTVQSTRDLDLADVTLLGDGDSYLQYLDDGITRDVSWEHVKKITRN